jgi:hypothetical protein
MAGSQALVHRFPAGFEPVWVCAVSTEATKAGRSFLGCVQWPGFSFFSLADALLFRLCCCYMVGHSGAFLGGYSWSMLLLYVLRPTQSCVRAWVLTA